MAFLRLRPARQARCPAVLAAPRRAARARTLAVLGTGLAGPEQPLEEMHRHALATTAPEDFETPADLRPPLRTDLH